MLFLDGNFKSVQGNTCFSNATQCICLLSAYLKEVNIPLVVVFDDGFNLQQQSGEKEKCFIAADINPKVGFKLPAKCFTKVLVKKHSEINANVKSCLLPAVYIENEQFLISGLCHILRFLVKLASNHFSPNLIQLLGHKKFCLKATSEVSSRTNLCEVIGPTVINNWNSTASSTIPEALLLIEQLLNEPVAIHNRDKRQRVVLKRLAEATLTTGSLVGSDTDEKAAKFYRTNLNSKLAVRTNDLPSLEHVFAEGVEFTLTDIALLPLVHTFFNSFSQNQAVIQNNLPSTYLWYNRVWNIPEISCAATLTSVTISTINQNNDLKTYNSSLSSTKVEILRLGNAGSNNPKKLKKKELEKTIRRDLPGVLHQAINLSSKQFQHFEKDLISLNWEGFPEEVHPLEGELSSKRALRKCQQIENLYYGIKSLCSNGHTIVDFCAGGGHVGIVIAFLLPQCNVIVIDNKEESLERARKRIKALNLKNIKVYQCNLQNFSGFFDIGVALHACGVATDLVLRKCLAVGASFVISPCCYGKIQNTETICYPQSNEFRTAGIDYDSLVLLGHAADQTSWDFEGEKPKQGKRCMELVDSDRAAFARESNYETRLFTMQPRDCSPKNNLILGFSPNIKSSKDPNSI